MKLKQAIIVRTDLGMGKGKIAGQVQAAESIRRYCPEWCYSWLDDDSLQTKIILKFVCICLSFAEGNPAMTVFIELVCEKLLAPVCEVT
jgi:Peptidyl-tRNA hydrolase PTH2